MTDSTAHLAARPALPAGRLLACVGGACAGVTLLTALAVPAMNLADGWRVWSAATMALLVSAAASLPWLVVAGKVVKVGDDPQRVADLLPKAAGLVIFAGVLRALVTGVAALLIVRGLKLPLWPSVGMLAAGYLALLATEAVVTGRAFWRVDSPPPPVAAG